MSTYWGACYIVTKVLPALVLRAWQAVELQLYKVATVMFKKVLLTLAFQKNP